MYHSSRRKSFRIFGKMRPAQKIEVDFLIYGKIGYPSGTSDLKNTFSLYGHI